MAQEGMDLLAKDALESGDALVAQIVPRMPQLLGALIDLATGHLAVGYKEGERRVYEVPPDRQAIQYLFDHVYGKAAQRQQAQKDTTIVVESLIPRPETVVSEPTADT